LGFFHYLALWPILGTSHSFPQIPTIRRTKDNQKITIPPAQPTLANAANGLQRSNADKQRAIEVCVKEFPELTQAKIAEMVGCSQRYVGMVKDGLNRNTSIEIPATITTARGQTRPTQYARNPSIFAPDAPEADPLPKIRTHAPPAASARFGRVIA